MNTYKSYFDNASYLFVGPRKNPIVLPYFFASLVTSSMMRLPKSLNRNDRKEPMIGYLRGMLTALQTTNHILWINGQICYNKTTVKIQLNLILICHCRTLVDPVGTRGTPWDASGTPGPQWGPRRQRAGTCRSSSLIIFIKKLISALNGLGLRLQRTWP